MKTPSAVQALAMTLALLACFTPAFGARELKQLGGLLPTCGCAQYSGCAKVVCYDAVNNCYQVDQSACGVCGLLGSILNAAISLPPLVCVKADVGILCNAVPCGINWGQLYNAAYPNGNTCTCTGGVVSATIDICVATTGLEQLLSGVVGSAVGTVGGLTGGLLNGLGK